MVPGQDRQLFLPPSPLNNSMRVLINVYNSIFRSRILYERRSCRIDFLLGERRREKERERRGEKKKEKEKKMEEIPVPGGKLQHHRPSPDVQRF